MNISEEMNDIYQLVKRSTLVDNSKRIKWTNIHDCPTGYSWNEEGWVRTSIPFLQAKVNMLPFLLSKLGEYTLLYQNAIAMRYLNNHSKEVIKNALRYKFITSYFRNPNEEVLSSAIEAAYAIENISDVLTKLSGDLFNFYDLWYSKECSFKGRKQIQAILKQRYIESSRDMMSIDTKYVTERVMEFADVSKYAVKKHWDITGLDKNTRTGRSIIDAIGQLMEDGNENPTQSEVAKVAGISTRTLRAHIGRLPVNKEIKRLNK